MLSEFSSILRIDIGATGLNHREKHDGPEDPRQLDDLVKVKRLVLLDQRLTSCGIRRGAKALMCYLSEDEEDEGA